jgi:hypothetical protein
MPLQAATARTCRPELIAAALATPGVEGHNTYRGFETLDGEGRTVFGAALGLAGRARRSFEFLSGDVRDVWSASTVATPSSRSPSRGGAA